MGSTSLQLERQPDSSGESDVVALPRLALAVPGVAAMFLAAVAVPLAMFTASLAVFGLTHVATEVRYLDHRFGARLGAPMVATLASLLGLAAALRLAGMTGWLPWSVATPGEILCAALAVLPLVRRACGPARWVAAGLSLALLLGATLAPFLTLLLLALTHNLTPLGFLAERLRGGLRRRALLGGGLCFLGLPLLIATGLPFAWLASLGLVAPEFGPFPSAGGLDANLTAYVPIWARAEAWALPVFSASVFAQCMHYAAVIGVLPRLIGAETRPVLNWPGARRFGWGLAAVCAALLTGFALDYGIARKVYALAALMHAWAELPVLLLALPGYSRTA